MKRTITITSCLALLCIAALALWMCMKYGVPRYAAPPEGTPIPHVDTAVSKGSNSDSQENKTPSGLAEKADTTPAVSELPTVCAFMGDGEFSPCFLDEEKNTLYRWKGVVLRIEQIRKTAYGGVPSGISLLNAKDFTVKEFDAPVNYWLVDGSYRPGYLDQEIWTFYAWKGVVLKEQEILDKSQDGKPALVKPTHPSQIIDVLEIDMPGHMKDHPELWKKKKS